MPWVQVGSTLKSATDDVNEIDGENDAAYDATDDVMTMMIIVMLVMVVVMVMPPLCSCSLFADRKA